MEDKYIPGQCNIGKSEQNKRLKLGLIGLFMICSLTFLYYVFAVDKFIILMTLLPASFIAIIGIIQSKQKFCVYYSALKSFKIDESEKNNVSNEADQLKDNKKSSKIITISILFSLLYTLLVMLFM